MKALIFSFILLVIGCGGSKSTNNPSSEGLNITAEEPLFLMDGQSGLFETVKWYSYDMSTHTIWSNLDVYLVKSSDQIYKLQILSYYNLQNIQQSAYFTLRIEDSIGNVQLLEVNAETCGNPFNNPDYENCLKDPAKNLPTYLNLKTLTSKKMTDQEAQKDSEWDIVFKNTELALNSGNSGPGSVVGALLYRDATIMKKNGLTDFNRLKEKLNADFDQKTFESLKIPTAASFYPPNGAQQIIQTSDWLLASDSGKEVFADLYWLLKTANNKVGLFHAASIEQTSATTYKLVFEYSLMNSQKNKDLKAIVLNADTADKSKSVCFSFEQGQDVSCSSAHDMKFNLGQEWSLQQNFGAMGPFGYAEASYMLERLSH